jgi:hypothetical protein
LAIYACRVIAATDFAQVEFFAAEGDVITTNTAICAAAHSTAVNIFAAERHALAIGARGIISVTRATEVVAIWANVLASVYICLCASAYSTNIDDGFAEGDAPTVPAGVIISIALATTIHLGGAVWHTSTVSASRIITATYIAFINLQTTIHDSITSPLIFARGRCLPIFDTIAASINFV